MTLPKASQPDLQLTLRNRDAELLTHAALSRSYRGIVCFRIDGGEPQRFQHVPDGLVVVHGLEETIAIHRIIGNLKQLKTTILVTG